MNKTVDLVVEWGKFEATHPDADIEAFCRHYLAQKKHETQQTTGTLVGGVVPRQSGALLLKIMGRLSKLNMSYANIALKGTGLNQIEEFGILVGLKQQKNPKKIEVINANLFEISSGTDMLTRMKKRGLLIETNDEEDKRSKRVELTPKGSKIIEDAKLRIQKNAKMITHSINEDDKQLCIQILKNLEITLSALWPQHRGKTFDEVYESIMGDEAD
jgi:DNA-binding MarR family transcriptional regulator